MRYRLGSVAKLLFLLILASVATAQTVEGTVVDAITGAGIPKISVNIQQQGQPQIFTTTDAEGHFHFENVDPGTYSVQYSTLDYSPPLETLRFAVTAGDLIRLNERLTPYGHISGRVVDGRGDPVSHAAIDLMAPGSVLMGFTGDKGGFDFRFGLTGGSHVLSALPSPEWKPPDPDPEGHKRAWVRTYYPGVAVPEAAQAITARPGLEITDLELKIQSAPAHALRGVLLDTEGKPLPKTPITAGEEQSSPFAQVRTAADGSFELSLPDGDWLLMADQLSEKALSRANLWIEVRGRDLEGLKLRLVPPFDVHGTVVVERPEGAPMPKLPFISVGTETGRRRRQSLPQNGNMGGPGAFTLPDENGRFVAVSMYPGRYRIYPTVPTPGYYLDSIRVGESETAPDGAEISSDVPITLVYKGNGAILRGTAEKCASGGVLMTPADPAMRRPGFYFMADCQSAGEGDPRYEIGSIRPGDYYVLEYPGDGPVPYHAADPGEHQLKLAAHVTLRAGEAVSLDLKPAAQ